MKHFKRHSLAILPLLSILAMSPSSMQAKFQGRSIASVDDQKIEIEKEPIKIEAPKIDVKDLKIDIPKIEPVEVAQSDEPKKDDGQDLPTIVVDKPKVDVPEVKVSVPDVKVDTPKVQVVNVKKEDHPRLTEMTSKVDPKVISNDPNLDIEKLKAKRDELKVALLKAREEFKKDSSDKKVVEGQRKEIEDLVINLLLVENGLNDLESNKKIDPTEDEKTKDIIAEAKDIAEGLIVDLESNEALVAKATPEEPKKDDAVVVKDDKKEENKKPGHHGPKKGDKEEKKEVAKDDEQCDQDKNLVSSKQLDNLIAQQNQIMQTLMNMSQMMMMQSMMMQQQMMMSQFNSMGTQNSPYQYANQTTAGNWVYYPQGFQPQQQNIFQPQGMGGMYPNQAQQSNWGLAPQNYFGAQPQMNAGTFGQVGALGYNMSAKPQMPQMSQAQVPTQNFIGPRS